MLDKLKRLDILQCSECGSSVIIHEDHVKCLGCSRIFPIENGIPLFSVDDIKNKGTGTTAEKSFQKKLKDKYPFLVSLHRLLSPPSLNFLRRSQSKNPLAHYLKQVAAKPDSVIVDIGAGSKRWSEVIALDIYNYPGIDLCARADKVPFKNNSVDMIVSRTAIEHMIDVHKVLSEMDRILKPDGIVFITAPFIYPYHPAPYDLHRWSADGLMRSFPGYNCIESGSVQGPHQTLYIIFSSYAAWIFSFGSRPIYMGLNLIFKWVFLPFRVLEVLRGSYRKSTVLDCTAYIVGQK